VELRPIAGRNVLLVDRFDRRGNQRVGFASALTMLEATDGERRSHPEIAGVIERDSPRSTEDLAELYRRSAVRRARRQAHGDGNTAGTAPF
jgi:serine/threonine-protein kinase HipA